MHNRLQEERKRLELNQDKFAEIGGVKRHSQVNYESGERCPDGRYFSAIAAAGADVQYILTGVRSITLAVKPKTSAQMMYVLKAATETVENANLAFTTDIKPPIAQILFGLGSGDIATINDAISIIKGQHVIDFDKSRYAFNSQAQGQKMAAEQNPGYSRLCQEQKQLLDNLAHCAPEDQEAIQRMAQLAAKANEVKE